MTNFEHIPAKTVSGVGSTAVADVTSYKSTNITIMVRLNAHAVGMKKHQMFVKFKTPCDLYFLSTATVPGGIVLYVPIKRKNRCLTTFTEQWFDNVFLEYCGTQRAQLFILAGYTGHVSVLGAFSEAYKYSMF